MPDLLLEILSEEIPARMQRRAADDLRKLVTDALVEAGLTYEGAKAFATPRRLALTVHGLPGRQPDRREERKGPRVGAPEGAVAGFLKAAGLASIDQARVQNDPKGDFYIAVTDRPGRAATDVIAEIVPKVIREFPWPKSMRWGTGDLRWVRPLQSILCTFGTHNEDPEIVDFEIGGIRSGATTRGHRFLSGGEINVRRFEDYVMALEKARVVLDADRRRDIILTDARDLAFAQGFELVEDDALLEEVAGLVEWPVVLMGAFEAEFLDVPQEVIRTTIRANQKCFVLRDPKTGRLANRFILVSNLIASDGGRAISAGNERVVRARLSDARFFWETDKRVPLAERAKKLENIVFHEKLGTQAERVERIARLAREIAPVVGADADLAERAARLAKADLVTETVGEFPEVQGLAGRYLATLQGEPEDVAIAIGDHYRPAGQGDRVPENPVAIAVALADKLDTLVGFWAIDEKPTGSKDPYALRRAALGVIRIVLENGLRLHLNKVLVSAHGQVSGALYRGEVENVGQTLAEESAKLGVALHSRDAQPVRTLRAEGVAEEFRHKALADADDLLVFFADRLKVQLREQGARHDLVDAVFALGSQDDLVLIVRRVEALAAFLATEDGKNLLAGYRRAANILRAEEKKDGPGSYDAPPDAGLLAEPAEKALHAALDAAAPKAQAAVEAEDFAAAMTALAALRPAVDAFFEAVTVNAEDADLRLNRLRLLNRLRGATLTVADFGRIGG